MDILMDTYGYLVFVFLPGFMCKVRHVQWNFFFAIVYLTNSTSLPKMNQNLFLYEFVLYFCVYLINVTVKHVHTTRNFVSPFSFS